jgi:hypothetical protein
MPDNDTIVAELPKETREVGGTARGRSFRLASVPREGVLRAATAPAPEFRLQHGAVHVHSLGARVLAEFLGEICSYHDIPSVILDLLDEYRRRLTVRDAGGDSLPRMPLRAMPR